MKKYGNWKNTYKGYIHEYISLLKNRALMKITAAGIISTFGSCISYFALLRKVYMLSNGKITDLGFLSVMEAIPFVIFGMAAGVIIDRFSRKKIMVLSDTLSGLIIFSVIFINNLNIIYFIAFLSSFVKVFRDPAQRSFEPNLVSKDAIPLLNSFKSSMNSLVKILGSAVGAAVVGFAGANNAFVIDGVSFMISAIIIASIFIKETHTEDLFERKASPLKELTVGIQIIWSDGCIKLMLLISIYLTFAMAMQGPLIYYFLKQTLKFGDRAEVAWGILLSSLGVGAILGSFVIGILIKRYSNRFKLFLDVLVFDACFFTLFLVNRFFPFSIAIFALLGCIGAANEIILNTVIQDTVANENRGKVFSSFSMATSPIKIFSILIGTWAASLISASDVLLIAAFLEFVIAIGVRFTASYRSYNLKLSSDKKIPL